MLYSTVIIAASAFAGFASAQNSSLPIPCCTVPVNSVPSDSKTSWCNANENTCVELCGGQGNIATNGNTCSDTDLTYKCKCSNGTDISSALGQYQQTVPSLMCYYWFDACINATGSDSSAQYQCIVTRNSTCGNKTSNGKSSSSPSGGSSSPSSTGTGSGSGSPSASATGSTKSNAAAHDLASFATPALVGGLLAVFGFAL